MTHTGVAILAAFAPALADLQLTINIADFKLYIPEVSTF